MVIGSNDHAIVDALRQWFMLWLKIIKLVRMEELMSSMDWENSKIIIRLRLG